MTTTQTTISSEEKKITLAANKAIQRVLVKPTPHTAGKPLFSAHNRDGEVADGDTMTAVFERIRRRHPQGVDVCIATLATHGCYQHLAEVFVAKDEVIPMSSSRGVLY